MNDLYVDQLLESKNRTIFIPFLTSGASYAESGAIGGLNQGGMLARDLRNGGDDPGIGSPSGRSWLRGSNQNVKRQSRL